MNTLPTLTLPKYNLTLPSSGKKISFRPFIVKEEKILLMAMEGEVLEEITDAVKFLISGCTFGKLDPEEIPLPDLCFLFINIRAKSVGEIASPNITCEFCKESNIIDVDLTKVKITKNKNHTNKISFDDGKGMVLKYPTIGMENVMSTDSETFSVIADCIDTIYDGDNVYKAEDYKKEELIEFIEGLSHKQFEDVTSFFTTMPELNHKIKFECKKCKEENNIKLEGIRDFFL